MKYTSLAFLFLGTFSAMAAGQENRGTSYCRDADIVCSTSQDVTQSTRVCIFKKYFNAAVFPSTDPKLYTFENVALVQVNSGVYGAGETYSGEGFSLHIKTDVLGSSAGTPSDLTVQSLDFDNLKMNCVERY